MFPTWQWSCFPCTHVDVHPASHSFHPISHLLHPTTCTHTGSDGYELGLLGFASLMEFIQSGKGGLGSARLLLDPHDPELPFPPGSRGSDNQHTAAGSIPHSISHLLSPYPASQFSYPVCHVLYPTSNILHPWFLYLTSHTQCPVSLHPAS